MIRWFTGLPPRRMLDSLHRTPRRLPPPRLLHNVGPGSGLAVGLGMPRRGLRVDGILLSAVLRLRMRRAG